MSADPVPEWWFIGPPVKEAVGSPRSEESTERKEGVMSNRIEPAVADGSAASPLADIGVVTSDLDAPAASLTRLDANA